MIAQSRACWLTAGALALSLNLGLVPDHAQAVAQPMAAQITAQPALRSPVLEATSALAGTTWQQQAELTATGTNAYFGSAVALSGDTAVIGAKNTLLSAPTGAASTGAAYVFVRSGRAWSLQATLIPGDGAPNDAFGSSVAVSGDTIAVGSPFRNGATGAVYVFVRSGTIWTQQAELAPSDGVGQSLFGNAVALSGNTVLVGARYHDSFHGAAYVFVRSGTTWTQQAEFADPLPQGRFDFFGTSVALSGDTALVATPQKNGSTGMAYVFVRHGSLWRQQAALADPLPRAAGDFFGTSVALGDNTAVIGAVGKNSVGAVYVYGRSVSTWSRQAILTAAGSASGDAFGDSVAFSGNTVLVGADGTNGNTGVVYVFVQSGIVWSQQATLMGSDITAGDAFGSSMAISGSTAVVGAPDKNNSTGAAYVFVRT